MLTDEDKEKIVLELLAQDKTVREICKAAKVSPGTVSRIKKGIRTNGIQSSIRTRAFKMFKRGKKPIDVAIILDVPHDETKKLWGQYLELNNESVFLKIKDELQGKFVLFVKLYKDMKANNSTVEKMRIGLETAQDIEAKTSYLDALREQISEAENKNSKLQEEIKEKINVITALNSEILSIQKVKNSVILQLRFAQEKMRNSFFTNGTFSEIPFQRP
jgi:Helix-turn-helix domain